MKRTIYLLAFLPLWVAAQTKSVKFSEDKTHHKIDVLVGGKPFTSYFFPSSDVLKKAVLYPVRTAKGTIITRGWPIDPRPGERIDHPHHVGMWLNYENVNGNDFWNNSNTPPNPNAAYGTIVHTGVKQMTSGKNKGTLVVTANWIDKSGKVILKEETTYLFKGTDNQRVIDRFTTLTAQESEVSFPDVKDGMFAIRVARALEHPSEKPEVFTDASGVATSVPVLDNTGITGSYRNSEGIEGKDVWAKRAKWVNLRGKIGSEDISLVIIDHPSNVGYPTYWHARDYGLFAANPLGQKVFSKDKEILNYKLPANHSVTFKYRVVVSSEKVADEEINKMTTDFSRE